MEDNGFYMSSDNETINDEIKDVESFEEFSNLSPEHVYQTAILLTRLNLPKDVIPRILDMGGFHATCLGAHNTKSTKVSEVSSGLIHTAALPPTGVNPRSIRAVVFETVSHDQGWSDHGHQGTYRDSWTWFEAGVATNSDSTSNAAAFGLDNGTPDGQEQQHRHRGDFRKIVTNVHASHVYRRHHVKWHYDDADPCIRNVFACLQEGQAVSVKVFARYPGWVNFVASTSISFEYLPVRRVP